MTRSFSQTHELECSRCQTRYAADVWLIVDGAERPDLWARCLDASIHVTRCPNGHTVTIDAPLLVHDADTNRLVYSPTKTTPSERALDVGRQLVDRLYAALSPEALDEYPTRVDLTPYRFLPLELRREPVPASLHKDTGMAGSDNLQGVLEEIVGLVRPADMPRRIQLCKDALKVIRPGDEAEHWAWLWLTLGNSLTDSLLGNRAENLKRAVQAYESALRVYTRETFPQQWAAIQNGLGNAYVDLVGPDRAQNLERARGAYLEALHVYTRKSLPAEWAMVQNNLGNVYADRIRGDRAQNLERAIQAYAAALEVRTREALPEEWAQTTDNLGHVYADRLLGDHQQNLERAIQEYEAALEVRTRDACPELWAATQINLGNAYAERRAGERADNFEGAIKAYEGASDVYTSATAPVRWATVQLNLAALYMDRVDGDTAENLEEAIRTCEQALEVCSRETSPIEWAGVQTNLGNAYRQRTRGNRAQNHMKSIQAYEAALEVYSPDRLPNEARRVARSLAQVHIEWQDSERAHAALQRAVAAANHLYSSAFTEEGRTVEIVESVLLYQQMVVICLRLSPPRPLESLLYVEDGRSRLLRDQLGTLSFPPPSGVPAELLDKETMLLRAARDCENVLRQSFDSAKKQEWVAKAAATRAALESLWDSLARDYAALDYVALRRGENLKWSDIQSCLSLGAGGRHA